MITNLLVRIGIHAYRLMVFGVVFLLKLACVFKVLKWNTWFKRESRRLKALPPGAQVWFHCASLGESKHMARLILELDCWTKKRILVTYQTKTAESFWRNFQAQKSVECQSNFDLRYFPLDCGWLMNPIKNSLTDVVIFESEVWPGMLHWCSRNKIKVHWVSVRLNAIPKRLKSKRLKYLGILLNAFPNWFHSIQPASNFEQQWLTTHLPKIPDLQKRIGPVASLKTESFAESFKIPPRLNVKENQNRIGVLSFHLEELPSLLEGIKCFGDHDFLLVPRYLEELEQIKEELQIAGVSFGEGFEALSNQRVCLIGQMGVIPQVLAKVELAWVGGSWAQIGLHNFYEALYLGVPVWVGPHYENLKEEVERCKHFGVLKVVEKKPNEWEKFHSEIEEFRSRGSGIEPISWDDFEKYTFEQTKQRQFAIDWIERQIQGVG